MHELFALNGFVILESLYSRDDSLSLVKHLDSACSAFLDFDSVSTNTPIIELLDSSALHTHLSSIFDNAPYTLHHLSATIHRGDNKSLAWHHDKVPLYVKGRSSQSDLMVHVLLYPSGLNSSVGELLLVPQSHTWPVDRYQLSCVPLDRMKSISVNSLPPGSAVIINSSLLHARQAHNSSVNCTTTRYLVDLSFCSALSKWEPYLESNADFRVIFQKLRNTSRPSKETCLSEDHLHSTTFYPLKIFSILPWKIARICYRLLSFFSRKFLHPPSRIRKIVL
jgi:hypothetical protein